MNKITASKLEYIDWCGDKQCFYFMCSNYCHILTPFYYYLFSSLSNFFAPTPSVTSATPSKKRLTAA